MVSARAERFVLPTRMDLDTLDQVRDRLVEVCEGGPVDVSGAGVERVSTNALFLLISAGETARRNDFAFSLSEASAPMLAAIERLGLGGAFADMVSGAAV